MENLSTVIRDSSKRRVPSWTSCNRQNLCVTSACTEALGRHVDIYYCPRHFVAPFRIDGPSNNGRMFSSCSLKTMISNKRLIIFRLLP